MHTFKAHPKPVQSIAFAADGRSLVTAAALAIRRWSVPEGEQLAEWPAEEHGPVAALAPDGRHLACGGRRFVLLRIDGAAAEVLVDAQHYSRSVAFSNDGETAFAIGVDGLARWSVRDGAALPGTWGGTRESNHGSKFPVDALAVHPNEPVLAAAFGVFEEGSGWDSAIEFFAIDRGKSLRMIRAACHHAHFSNLCFSPDGRVIVATSGPLWRAWNVATGEEIARAKTGRKHLLGVTFTADGERLVTVGNDASARVFAVADGREERGYDWDIGPLTCVAASPDGCLLAAGSRRGKVVLWDDEPR